MLVVAAACPVVIGDAGEEEDFIAHSVAPKYSATKHRVYQASDKDTEEWLAREGHSNKWAMGTVGPNNCMYIMSLYQHEA